MRLSHRSFSPFAPGPTPASSKRRPGAVEALCGIIIQCDAKSLLGDIFIRPVEALDLWFAGLADHHAHGASRDPVNRHSLGMHAGLHVVLEDGRHFVVEQLSGGWREWLINGLHWTPLQAFQGRERRDVGGWDVTIPIHHFRQLDEFAEKYALTHLHSIRGRPFLHEDCTGFIGRVFGPQRRVFADSPILRALGIDLRSGEPALPLLHHDAALETEVEQRLRGRTLRRLPDPAAEGNSISLRQLHQRAWLAGAGCAALAAVAALAICASNSRSRRVRRRWS